MSDSKIPFKKEVVGFLEVNCYIVPSECGSRVYVIDPGASPAAVAETARSFGVEDYVVLLTHAHIDHISGVPELMDILPVSKFFFHQDDMGLYESPANELQPLMPALTRRPAPSRELDFDDFSVIHTPGHTRGSVCYHFPAINALFSGDTLFRESVGRTDLPGGDWSSLERSIRSNLYTLDSDLQVFPGHGAPTTIGHEKANNPYVT